MKKVTKIRLSLALATVTAATPLPAQGVDDLPNRPIRRTEVESVVRQQFAAMDVDRNGIVTPAEFDRYRKQQTGNAMGPLTRIGPRWFARTDADANGQVTRAEAMIRPLKFFDLADTNRDGIVSLDERRIAAILFKLGGR